MHSGITCDIVEEPQGRVGAVSATGDVKRVRAPASCRSGGAAARPGARAGEAEEGGAEAEVGVDAAGTGVGQDADLGVDDADGGQRGGARSCGGGDDAHGGEALVGT